MKSVKASLILTQNVTYPCTVRQVILKAFIRNPVGVIVWAKHQLLWLIVVIKRHSEQEPCM